MTYSPSKKINKIQPKNLNKAGDRPGESKTERLELEGLGPIPTLKAFDRVVRIRRNLIGSVDHASEHCKWNRYSKEYSKQKNMDIKKLKNQKLAKSIQITPARRHKPTTSGSSQLLFFVPE